MLKLLYCAPKAVRTAKNAATADRNKMKSFVDRVKATIDGVVTGWRRVYMRDVNSDLVAK